MKENRRAFLKNTAKLSAGLALAFAFGSSLRAEIDKRDGKKIALLYASRYGATRDTAQWIAQGTDREVSLVDIAQNDPATVLAEHDLLIIGTGIWVDGAHSDIRSFTRNYAVALRDKLLAIFVVCGTEPTNGAARRRIEGYLQQIAHPLKQQPPFKTHLGGRIIVEQLNDEDKAALTRFYRDFLNKDLESWDRTSPGVAKNFGASFKGMLEHQ